MSVETATRTGRLAFRGLCMQHGYNSKRLAEEIGMPEPDAVGPHPAADALALERGRGRLQDTGDLAG